MTRALAPFALIAAFAVLSAVLTRDAPMSDLLATWLAGHFYGQGEVGQIYPADTRLYTMQPPSDWTPLMRERGYLFDIFPFIYPPLWAWVAAGIAAVLSPEGLFTIARVLNPLLIGATVWLAARATRGTLPPALFVGLGLIFIGFTNIGQVALIYGQPQILVSFLTVLAIERARNGAPVWGGAVMALAASIKLYPALYALVWLLAGRWRIVAAFGVVGLAMGVLSIAVAGWPLHAAFLHQVRVIGDTVLLTKLNFSLDPVIGQLFLADRFTFAPQAPGEDGGWFLARKGPLWSAISGLGVILSILLSGWLLRRSDDPLVWPLVMILGSLFTPLSWVYHYLAPVAFAPALLDRLGTRAGGLLLVLAFVPLLMPSMSVIDGLSPTALPFQGASVLCLMILAGGFGWAVATNRAR